MSLVHALGPQWMPHQLARELEWIYAAHEIRAGESAHD